MLRFTSHKWIKSIGVGLFWLGVGVFLHRVMGWGGDPLLVLIVLGYTVTGLRVAIKTSDTSIRQMIEAELDKRGLSHK